MSDIRPYRVIKSFTKNVDAPRIAECQTIEHLEQAYKDDCDGAILFNDDTKKWYTTLHESTYFTENGAFKIINSYFEDSLLTDVTVQTDYFERVVDREPNFHLDGAFPKTKAIAVFATKPATVFATSVKPDYKKSLDDYCPNVPLDQMGLASPVLGSVLFMFTQYCSENHDTLCRILHTTPFDITENEMDPNNISYPLFDRKFCRFCLS